MDLDGHRPILFGLAYRMLGRAQDAEDIVQDAFLRYAERGGPARTPGAYLRTTVVRLCLDRLKSAQYRRERLTDMPDPIVDDGGEAAAMLAESLTLAFLRLMQALTPLERAVFLLHEVFGLEHREIAAAVSRSEASCRQTLRRARRHVAEGKAKYATDDDAARLVVDAFAAAAAAADYDRLFDLLAPGVVMRTDGAGRPYGRATAIRKAIDGRARVARFVAAVQGQAPADLQNSVGRVNGGPAIFCRRDGALIALLSFRVVDGRIEEIFLFTDPKRLDRLSRAG